MTNNRLSWLFSIVAAILVRPFAAQELPTPQQLIDAAHRASDLTNLGPYTLSANVRIDSGDKKTIKTGRLLIVRDRRRTREELELGGVREVRFFLDGKLYIVPPQGFLSGMGLLDFDRRWDPVHFIAARFNSVRSDKVEGADAWCLNREWGQRGPSPCFDAVKGVYLGYIPNERRSTEFFDFASVGNHLLYPTRATMLRDDVGRIEVNSIEIKPGAAKDGLFTLPDNAIEIATCNGLLKPLYTPEPNYPERERRQKKQTTVHLSVIIDKEGNVASAQAFMAPTEGFAREAEATVRKWRFEPAMCDGEPVFRETEVQVDFHLY